MEARLEVFEDFNQENIRKFVNEFLKNGVETIEHVSFVQAIDNKDDPNHEYPIRHTCYLVYKPKVKE